MTEDQRWAHHTRIYAHRIVHLEVPETVHHWEGDPEGKYFDANMIAAEVNRLERQKERRGSARPVHRELRDDPLVRYRDPRDDPHVRAQREVIARLKGFPDWDSCLEAMWQDAVAHAHPITGQPDAVGALERSGIEAFCRAWRERLVQKRKVEDEKAAEARMLEKLQRKITPPWFTQEDLP